VSAAAETRVSPGLRTAIRAAGLSGLALIAIAVSLTDVIARAPADAVGRGPPLTPPSAAFPFGTDILGRDVLSETAHALTVTLANSGAALAVALAAGGFAGFLAARLPFRSGFVLRWAMGIFAAIPALLLAVLIVGIGGRDLWAVAAGLAAAPAGFVRAFDRARRLSAAPHAEYARASGIPASTLLKRDLVHEFRDTFLSIAARGLAAVAITLSTVSFFGFGAVPPHRDLGLMIAAARPTYLAAWWTAGFPALVLVLLILCARLAAALEEGERP